MSEHVTRWTLRILSVGLWAVALASVATSVLVPVAVFDPLHAIQSSPTQLSAPGFVVRRIVMASCIGAIGLGLGFAAWLGARWVHQRAIPAPARCGRLRLSDTRVAILVVIVWSTMVVWLATRYLNTVRRTQIRGQTAEVTRTPPNKPLNLSVPPQWHRSIIEPPGACGGPAG